MQRKEELATGNIYHVFGKSIEKFKIFNRQEDYLRLFTTLRYYQIEKPTVRLSIFLRSNQKNKDKFSLLDRSLDQQINVQILAYCLMPTHFHLILKQLNEPGISYFMGKVLNSYAKYFNVKYKRKGPLWESRFNNVVIENDDHLLHHTRYVHLNPVTAYLVDKPSMWKMSSYNEYLSQVAKDTCICDFKNIIEINPKSYCRFVEDRISCQRELADIKKQLED